MPKPFHYYLPAWAHNSLKTRICSQCKTKYTKEDISAIGIRETGTDNCSMYIEHKCSECGFRALTTLGEHKEETIEGLCCVILEYINKKRLAEKSKLSRNNAQNSPMTDKEVKSFLKHLNNTKFYDDFLKEIGVKTPKNTSHRPQD